VYTIYIALKCVQHLHELYEASVYGALDVVKFFLKYTDVSPSITNHFGWTPLHGAVANGHFECAQLLLERKAESSPISDTGKTPIDFLNSGETHYDHILTRRMHYKELGCTEKTLGEEIYTPEQRFQMEELLEKHEARSSKEQYESLGSDAFDKQKYSHPGWGGYR
jgi:ankyrin repeat protein